MLSRIPLNFGLFGLMVPVLMLEGSLAQTSIGFILSAVLLMPFWSVAIINAVFVGITIEVLARKLSKLWLLVPGAWFLGNAALAGLDHAALAELRGEIASTNARAKLPFDPARDALVLGEGVTPQDILSRYDVPQVYVRSKDPVNEPPYMVYRLTSPHVCSNVKEGAARTAANWTQEGWFKNEALGEQSGYCVIGMAAAAPERPFVVSKFGEPDTTLKGMPLSVVRLRIERPGGPRIEARTGTAKALPWLPLPFFGCFRDSYYKAGMTCYHRMDRWSEQLTNSSDIDLIGRALSLPAGPSGQSVNEAEEMWKFVGQAGSYRRDWQIRRLDAFLANPDDPAPLKVSMLGKDRSAIGPRIPRILALAARYTGEDNYRHDEFCEAFGLVLTLDAATLKPHRQQIRKLAAADDCYGNQYDIATGENLRPDPDAEVEAAEARQEAEQEARPAAEAAKPVSPRPSAPPAPPPPYRGPLASPSAKFIVPGHP